MLHSGIFETQGEVVFGEFAGEAYANEMEFLLKKCNVELVKFDDKRVKGANGEELIHILLRVVGYK